MRKIISSFLFTLLLMTSQTQTQAAEQILFIGTAGTGIYACTLDMETGELSEPQLAVEAPKPGFLALHPNQKYLYAVTAEATTPSGGVRAYEIERASRTLKLINQQNSGDEGATHLQVDHNGKVVVVAHYSGGSTSALAIAEDGALNKVNGFIRHEGTGADPKRQEKPHAHGAAVSPDNKFVCIADLGTDHVDVYKLSAQADLEKSSFWKAKPGAGPRHLMFHPNGKWLYSINELDSTISGLNYDSQSGELTEIDTVTTLPEDFHGENSTAELAIHPNGKFLYGSNRGHDSTAVYRIEETGKLALIEIEPTQGGHPRFIGLDPSGTFLIAANRDTDNLVSFRVDQQSGELTPTGNQAKAPKPICVVFLR
jgi:6-phosphogluconolactonase